MECFGNVVLRCICFHEVAIATFSKRGQANQLLAGSDCASQFGPGYPELDGRVAFQRAKAEHTQLIADVIDPCGILANEKVALGYEECHQCGSPGPLPFMLGHSRLRPMNALDSGFKIYPGFWQVETYGAPTFNGIRAERPTKLGQEWVEPTFDRRSIRLSPQGLGQLGPVELAMPIGDEVGEEQAALATGQLGLDALTVVLDRQRTADLDAEMIGGRRRHPDILAVRWTSTQRRRTNGETDSLRMWIHRPGRQR